MAGCNGFPVDGVFVALCFPGGERYWKQSDGDVLQITYILKIALWPTLNHSTCDLSDISFLHVLSDEWLAAMIPNLNRVRKDFLIRHLSKLPPIEPPKKKHNSYYPLYWLVNRGPYNGLYWFIIIPIKLGSIIPGCVFIGTNLGWQTTVWRIIPGEGVTRYNHWYAFS